MSAKINDMYYAYSANDDIKSKGEYGGVVTTIMKYLLESGTVDAVVGVEEGHDLYDGVPCLVTKPEDVKHYLTKLKPDSSKLTLKMQKLEESSTVK